MGQFTDIELTELRLVSGRLSLSHLGPKQLPPPSVEAMSGMQNGHIAKDADGEALKQHVFVLSLRCNRDANSMTEEDICPVCKNSTYLQKNLRFKINTKCYHRICEGCVDRITSTQKKCPIAGCPFAARGVIPRRGDYKIQTFEDLAIEREVDIRRRVIAILNRHEEEFDTKRAWDNFLEQREEMIMNLVLKTDIKKTEAALNKYKEANADVIKANAARERTQAAAAQDLQTYGREQAHLRRRAAHQEYGNDRLGNIEKGTLLDGRGLAARSRNAQAATDKIPDGEGPVADPSGLVLGLKRKRAPPPEKMYDPFMGMTTTKDYYTLHEDYPSIRFTKAKNDTRTRAGGFDFDAYFDESLLHAFAGLGCFIDEEQAGRAHAVSKELATVVAAKSSPGVTSDQVF